MRFLISWAFDTYINLRYVIAESVKQIHYQIDDAFDAWGEEEEDE